MEKAIAHFRKSDKKEQTVGEHLLEVGRISRDFAAKIGLSNQGELMGLLHDLGKYSNEFQSYIRSAVGLVNPDEDDYVDAEGKKGKIDHSTAGAQFIQKKLSHSAEFGPIAAQFMALGLVSHHSGLIDCISADGKYVYGARIKKREECSHLEEALENIEANILDRLKNLIIDPDTTNAFKNILSSIAKRDLQPGIDPLRNPLTQFKFGLLVRFLYSCLIDADRIDTANFENPASAKKRNSGFYRQWNVLSERLENHLETLKSTRPIDLIRSNISDECLKRSHDKKGIFTLTVPTGGGKTLASLRFALNHAEKHNLDRIIFVIPFTTIIDQNADVARKILEIDDAEVGSIVLENHSNLLPDKETWKGKILAEDWDAPIIYTTSVKFLDCLFGHGTRDARRMHQLARSVIVFDEVQTLPIKCVHLFCNAINFLIDHCGSTAVLCTATQPLFYNVDKTKGSLELNSLSELIARVEAKFSDLKRVEVMDQTRPKGWNDAEIAELACKELQDSGSCLVIVNTKKSARALFTLCEKRNKERIYHLSTNMCPAHRREVLNEIRIRLDRKEPVLAISTQLIEAGVDIDFGSVIRFSAGLDSIAQAAGRCNRNGRPIKGRIYIVNANDDGTEMLKDIEIGKGKAQRVLDEFRKEPDFFHGDLLSPAAIDRYFQYYFYDRANEMSYTVSVNDIGRDDTLLDLLSTNPKSLAEFSRTNGNEAQKGNIVLPQSFRSAGKAFKAIDAPTQGIIVPHGKEGKSLIVEFCSAFMIEKQYELLKRAQRFSVNVFPNVLKKLNDEQAIHEVQQGTGIYYLDEQYYSNDFGVCLEVVSPYEPKII
jgi:CRISPR-associated endonuclease/helicase Cas3